MNRRTKIGIVLMAALLGSVLSVEIIRYYTPANHSGADGALMWRTALLFISSGTFLLVGLLMLFVRAEKIRLIAACLIGIALIDLFLGVILYWGVFKGDIGSILQPIQDWLRRAV